MPRVFVRRITSPNQRWFLKNQFCNRRYFHCKTKMSTKYLGGGAFPISIDLNHVVIKTLQLRKCLSLRLQTEVYELLKVHKNDTSKLITRYFNVHKLHPNYIPSAGFVYITCCVCNPLCTSPLFTNDIINYVIFYIKLNKTEQNLLLNNQR